MAVISTNELFEKYFESIDDATEYKIRGQIERPEVYAYEIEIGKQLVDMDVEELFNMICSFKGVGNAKSPSFPKHVSNFKLIFQFYIENYENKANPFHHSKFKRLVSSSVNEENENRLTYADVQKTIERLHERFNSDMADYYECLMLLFYCGLSEPKEIALIKENMINFRRKEIEIDGHFVRLNDRCFDLLVRFHTTTILTPKRGSLLLESWNGSYFRFPIKGAKIEEFKSLSEIEIARKIGGMICKNISAYSDIPISARSLYLLGFYDYLRLKYGEERVREMVLSCRVDNDIVEFKRSMKEYGMSIDRHSYIRSCLKPFI